MDSYEILRLYIQTIDSAGGPNSELKHRLQIYHVNLRLHILHVNIQKVGYNRTLTHRTFCKNFPPLIFFTESAYSSFYFYANTIKLTFYPNILLTLLLEQHM